MARKAQINARIQFDSDVDISGLQKGLNKIQGEMKNLSLPDKLEREFDNLFRSFEKSAKSLSSMEGLDFGDTKNLNNYIKELRNVLDVADKISEKSSDLSFKDINVSNLNGVKQTFNSIRESLEQYDAAMIDVQATWKKTSGVLKKTIGVDINLDNLQELVLDSEKARGKVDHLKESLSAMISTKSSGKWSSFEELSTALTNAKNDVNTLQTEITDFQSKIDSGGLGADEVEKLQASLKDSRELLTLAKGDVSELTIEFNKWEGANNAINNIKKALDEAGDSVDGIDVQKLERELEGAEQALLEIKNTSLANLVKEMLGLGNASQKASDEVDKMDDHLEELTDSARQLEGLKNRLIDVFSIDKTLELFQRGIRNAWQTVKELDAEMAEIAVVTDFNVSDVWDMRGDYVAKAKELGAATVDVVRASALYYQQGLSQAEVTAATTETIKMARIASLDGAKATDLMTAAIRGFNMEMTDAQRVNDVYSELAAKAATDVNELATAMTKTASIADSAGMSFENTSALLTQMIETTRESPENLGTAMKSIVARFQEMKKSPDKIFELDGEVVNVNKVEEALRSVGIALRDETENFRNLDEVFFDISKRWDSMTNLQQRYVATIAAGSRQQSRFIAMVSNNARLLELQEYAHNSEGASTTQFNKTLDTVQAKLNQLKTEAALLWTHLLDSKTIHTFIEAGTAFIKILNGILEKMPSIAKFPTLIIASITSMQGMRGIIRNLFEFLMPENQGASISKVGPKLVGGLIDGLAESIKRNNGKVRDILTEPFTKGLDKINIKFPQKIAEGFGKISAAAAAANTSIASMLIPIAAVAAAAIVAGKIIARILETNSFSGTEKRLELVTDLAMGAEEAAKEATKAYEDLLAGETTYGQRLKEISELTEGTKEWRQAILETNAEIMDLLEISPELAGAVRVDKNGLLKLNERDWKVAQEAQIDRQQQQFLASAGFNAQKLQLEIQLKKEALQELYKVANVDARYTGLGDAYRSSTNDELAALLKRIADADNYEGGFFRRGANGEYSKALMEVAESAQTSAAEVYALKGAYEAYINTIKTNQPEMQSQMALALQGLVPDDASSIMWESGNKLSDAFAQAYVDNASRMEQDIKTKLNSTDWGAGLSDEVTEALKAEYEAATGLMFEDLPDSIQNSADKVKQAIASGSVQKSFQESFVKIYDGFEKAAEEATVSPEAQKKFETGLQAMTSLMSMDTSGLSLNIQKSILDAEDAQALLEDYAEAAGFDLQVVAEILEIPIGDLGKTLKNKADEQAKEIKSNVTELPKMFDSVALSFGKGFDKLIDPLKKITGKMNVAELEAFSSSFTDFFVRFGKDATVNMVEALNDLHNSMPTEKFNELLGYFNEIDASDPSQVQSFIDAMMYEDWGAQESMVHDFLNAIDLVGPALQEVDMEQLWQDLINTNKLLHDLQFGENRREFSAEEAAYMLNGNPDLANDFIINQEGQYLYVGEKMDVLGEAIRANTDATIKDTTARLSQEIQGVESLIGALGGNRDNALSQLSSLQDGPRYDQIKLIEDVRDQIGGKLMEQIGGLSTDINDLSNLSDESIDRIISNLVRGVGGLDNLYQQLDFYDQNIIAQLEARSQGRADLVQTIINGNEEEARLAQAALQTTMIDDGLTGSALYSTLIEKLNSGTAEEKERLLLVTTAIADLRDYALTLNNAGIGEYFEQAFAAFNSDGVLEDTAAFEEAVQGIVGTIEQLTGIKIDPALFQDLGSLEAFMEVLNGGDSASIDAFVESLGLTNQEAALLIEYSKEVTSVKNEEAEAKEKSAEASRREAEAVSDSTGDIQENTTAKEENAAAAERTAEAKGEEANQAQAVADASQEEAAAKDEIAEASERSNAASERTIELQQQLVDLMSEGKLNVEIVEGWETIAARAQTATEQIIEYVEDVAQALTDLESMKIHLTGSADYSPIISEMNKVMDKASEVSNSLRRLASRTITFRVDYQQISFPTSSGGRTTQSAPRRLYGISGSGGTGFRMMSDNMTQAYGLPMMTPTMMNQPVMNSNGIFDSGIQMGFASSTVGPTNYGFTGGGDGGSFSSGSAFGAGDGNGINVTGISSNNAVMAAKSSSKKEEKEEEPWKNTFDRIYNLVKATARLGRHQEALSHEMGVLLKDTNFTLDKVLQNIVNQKSVLENQLTFWKKQHSERTTDLAALQSEFSDVKKYASLTADGIVQIDWDSINTVTDQEEGKKIADYIKKLEDIQGEFESIQDNQQKIYDKLDELVNQGKKEYLDLEKQLFDALVKKRKDEIDKLKDIEKAATDSTKDLLAEIKQGISEMRARRNEQKQLESINEKERRLSLLKSDTSGANALDILALEEELANERQSYTDSLIDKAIDNMQEGNDAAAEQRTRQIELMEAQLEKAQSSGEIWNQVYNILTNALASNDVPAFLAAYLKESQSYDSMSNLQKEEWMNALKSTIEGAFSWYIEKNKLTGDLKGQTITFTDASGKQITGTVNSDGSVTANGSKYTGIVRGPNGQWVTSKAAQKITTPKPADPPTDKPGNSNNGPIVKGGKVKASPSASIYDWRDGKNPERQYFRNDPYYTVLQMVGDWVQVRHKSLSKGITGWFKKGDLTAYKKGGLIDFTGPAWVDGSKSNPESILSSADTKNFITLKNILSDVMKKNSTANSSASGDIFYQVDIHVDEIADGYDVDKMMGDIEKHMVNKAMYRNVNAINRMK